MSGSRRCAAVVLGALLSLSACSPAGRTVLPALHRLDERHAPEFQQAFDRAMDRPRYVVALSPT